MSPARVATRGSLATALVALLVLFGAPRVATAHGFEPIVCDLTARGAGRYALLLKLPRASGEVSESTDASGSAAIRVELPARCRELAAPVDAPTPGALLRAWSVDCGARGLAGATIGASVARGPTDTAGSFELILRYRATPDEREEPVVLLLDDREPRVTLPGPTGGDARTDDASWWRVGKRYVALGVHHILSGLDHLLFVLGLILLARGRALVAAVTAFTLGHSATLALAALGVVRVPQAPVETCIAASVALLAVERLRRDERGAGARTEPATARGATARMAAAFGLLHGLGFAGALSEAGLPRTRVPLALAGFNVGVELGQLAFVAACLAVGAVASRVGRMARVAPARAAPWIARGMGVLAAWWAGARLADCWLSG